MSLLVLFLWYDIYIIVLFYQILRILAAFQPRIELEYFDLVGGKESFENECGGLLSLPEKYTDASFAKANKVSNV